MTLQDQLASMMCVRHAVTWDEVNSAWLHLDNQCDGISHNGIPAIFHVSVESIAEAITRNRFHSWFRQHEMYSGHPHEVTLTSKHNWTPIAQTAVRDQDIIVNIYMVDRDVAVLFKLSHA